MNSSKIVSTLERLVVALFKGQ